MFIYTEPGTEGEMFKFLILLIPSDSIDTFTPFFYLGNHKVGPGTHFSYKDILPIPRIPYRPSILPILIIPPLRASNCILLIPLILLMPEHKTAGVNFF